MEGRNQGGDAGDAGEYLRADDCRRAFAITAALGGYAETVGQGQHRSDVRIKIPAYLVHAPSTGAAGLKICKLSPRRTACVPVNSRSAADNLTSRCCGA